LIPNPIFILETVDGALDGEPMKLWIGYFKDCCETRTESLGA